MMLNVLHCTQEKHDLLQRPNDDQANVTDEDNALDELVSEKFASLILSLLQMF